MNLRVSNDLGIDNLWLELILNSGLKQHIELIFQKYLKRSDKMSILWNSVASYELFVMMIKHE